MKIRLLGNYYDNKNNDDCFACDYAFSSGASTISH